MLVGVAEQQGPQFKFRKFRFSEIVKLWTYRAWLLPRSNIFFAILMVIVVLVLIGIMIVIIIVVVVIVIIVVVIVVMW